LRDFIDLFISDRRPTNGVPSSCTLRIRLDKECLEMTYQDSALTSGGVRKSEVLRLYNLESSCSTIKLTTVPADVSINIIVYWSGESDDHSRDGHNDYVESFTCSYGPTVGELLTTIEEIRRRSAEKHREALSEGISVYNFYND